MTEQMEHQDPEEGVEKLELDTDASEQEAAVGAEGDDGEDTPPAPQYSEEDAQEARLFNWKPREEWKGELPPNFVDDPTEYLERIKNSKPVKVMQSRIDDLDRQYSEKVRRLEEMSRRALEWQKQQHEQKLADLTTQQRRAAEEGDMSAYDAAERQKQDLMKDAPSAQQGEAKDQPQQEPPEVAEYRQSEQGQWLNNPILRQTAAQLIDSNPAVLGKPAKVQIDYAESELRKMYPAYFPQENKGQKPQAAQQHAKVDPGGLAGGGSGKSEFDKLPADAKSQFKQFVQKGVFKDTKEDRKFYAEEYNNAG